MRVFMNGAVLSFCSVTQKFVKLPMTKMVIAAGKMVAKDMHYMYHLLESLKLEVELPMVLEMQNSGPLDIAKKHQPSPFCHNRPAVSRE